jgi:peptidoglycan/xylan/chitin deacetylase (PgdA/CDA1 family)
VSRGAAGPTSATLLWRVDTDEPVAALTFDDGPDPDYTPAILDTLAEHDAVATFFMQGTHAEAHADLARRVAEIHAIGNHTYSHVNLGSASAGLARDQIGRGHEVLEQITGKAPIAFRPPYGMVSGAASMAAAEQGYDIVLWSHRITSRSTPEQQVHKLCGHVGAGSIILGHDGGSLDNTTVVQTLPALLDDLDARSIRLVTIPDLAALRSSTST